jgi:hypothetical protein
VWNKPKCIYANLVSVKGIQVLALFQPKFEKERISVAG